ncbi:GNAT family N-acetyltransferase [Sinanaerobacter chloroacetimidivorans]|uniref:GNAT family N-acetyltransferase n=1 Tax=Sinanaerobacter chloroacetimidivorans TaxID=2818044 RepID=A0A8J8B2W7_9FIRM|nr:GNAT family N-acetyltransferase [Sinanaerobacter chloroacetimidivorans]MBR0599156.1 GNAT family N-acetyltransferase [Sinanaerobacter chloroacetimidivorans]
MKELRLSKETEIPRLKEMWKLCFGDEDSYIDYYFAHRYRQEDTAVLLSDGKIASMLTMIPVWLVLPQGEKIKASMLYAIATHPQYQGRGLAGELMDFANDHLAEKGTSFSMLVPAEKSLFRFYQRQGYQEAFYLREIKVDDRQMKELQRTALGAASIAGKFYHAGPEEYNKIRESHFRNHFHVAYEADEFSYQKKISQLSGADLYGIDFPGYQGCMLAERIDEDKVLIKELLASEKDLVSVILETAKLLPAAEYFFRMPAFLGQSLEASSVRPFGMIRNLHDHSQWRKEKVPGLKFDQSEVGSSGYLGLAFD